MNSKVTGLVSISGFKIGISGYLAIVALSLEIET
jgi:hypothetical protein